MNLYDAIMKAADRIESDPHHFKWMSVEVPNGCGSPGCAVGWIGHFLGFSHDSNGFVAAVKTLTGTECAAPFYDRMDALSPHFDWSRNSKVCAATLRRYAAKYCGHEKPEAASPPDWNAIAAKQTVGTDARSEELTWA